MLLAGVDNINQLTERLTNKKTPSVTLPELQNCDILFNMEIRLQ